MAAEQYPLNEALKQQFLAIVNERNPQKCEHALEMLCPWYYPQGNSTSSEYQHLYPYAQIAVLEAAKVGNNTVLTSLLGTGAGWVAPNCADENGQTPLHLAVANNQLKSVQLLLSLDQAPWLTTKMEDKQGNTPLDMAQGNKQLHDLLSAYSSNLSPQHPPGGPLLHLEADDEGKQEEKHDETPLVSQSLLEKQAAFVQYILTPLVQNILSKFSIHVYQDGVV
ncbi:MAG: hypothetical protein K0Q74_1629, partial [Gammaproteobacteria bacterium]|nr:hypothetical protein [Gammaproteobacteria bacterium]